jgi:peptidoglycan/LPS O-acetylase OafA/YrhL
VDVLDAIALLMAAGGTVMLVGFWKVRPVAVSQFQTVAFWLWPASVAIVTWLLPAGYLISKHAPEGPAKSNVVLLLGGLLLVDAAVMFVVAPLMRSRAATRARRTRV